jgi:hypothetical protein
MKLALAISFGTLLLVACGGGALQTISLSNQTPRTIKELYVYPIGSDKGKSRGSLAPSASTTVQMPKGNVEVRAVSELIIIDEHTRDTPTASQALELVGPLKVIFFDGPTKPAALDNPGVIGISFILSEKKPAPDSNAAPVTP